MPETFPLPDISEGSAIPGNESYADKYFAPEINRVRRALNEVEARVRALETAPATPSVALMLTPDQEQRIAGLVPGSTIVLLTSADVVTTRIT